MRAIPRATCCLEMGEAQCLSECLLDAGALSVSITDAEGREVLEPPSGQDFWGQVRLSALFETHELREAALGLWIHYPFDRDELPPQDWFEAYRRDVRPLMFGGGRLWVCPSWDLPKEASDPIILDPGCAFGTGQHATTALCLEYLATHPPFKQRVLDFGCGSGILSLAALKLGASEVWALDCDPQACQATERNAQSNQLSEYLRVIQFAEDVSSEGFEVVIANIVCSVLCGHAAWLCDRLKTSGTLVLSGLLEGQDEPIKKAFVGIQEWTLEKKEGWLLMVGHL